MPPQEIKHLEIRTLLRTVSFIIALAALCFIIYSMVKEKENPSYAEFKKFMETKSSDKSLKDIQLFVPNGVSPGCFGNCYNYWFIGYKGPWEKGVDEFYKSSWLDFCADTCNDKLTHVS